MLLLSYPMIVRNETSSRIRFKLLESWSAGKSFSRWRSRRDSAQAQGHSDRGLRLSEPTWSLDSDGQGGRTPWQRSPQSLAILSHPWVQRDGLRVTLPPSPQLLVMTVGRRCWPSPSHWASDLESEFDHKATCLVGNLTLKPSAVSEKQRPGLSWTWVWTTAHLCTSYMPTSEKSTVLWPSIRAEGRRLICLMSAVQPGSAVLVVEGWLMLMVYSILIHLWLLPLQILYPQRPATLPLVVLLHVEQRYCAWA